MQGVTDLSNESSKSYRPDVIICDQISACIPFFGCCICLKLRRIINQIYKEPSFKKILRPDNVIFYTLNVTIGSSPVLDNFKSSDKRFNSCRCSTFSVHSGSCPPIMTSRVSVKPFSCNLAR